MLGVESAEACGLACSGASAELACSCAAGACWSAAGVMDDGFAVAAGDAAAFATGGDDGLAGGTDTATGEAVAVGAIVTLAGDTGPVAGARDSSLIEVWLTAGAPVDGLGRAGAALADGAVDRDRPAVSVSANSGLAVLRSAFSILSGSVTAILGPSDFGASASLVCGGGSGPISAAGFFDPAGEDVAGGSTDAGAEATTGARITLASLTFCSAGCCFATSVWT